MRSRPRGDPDAEDQRSHPQHDGASRATSVGPSVLYWKAIQLIRRAPLTFEEVLLTHPSYQEAQRAGGSLSRSLQLSLERLAPWAFAFHGAQCP